MSATIALPSSVAARSGTRRPFRLWPEWLTLSLYASILAFAIPFHEPWADEAQAWQMAGHSSLLHLFTTTLRYEGHPALWYILLKILQHLGVGYSGMQWFAGSCATLAAGLLIFRAPFPRLARLTLPFTFFLAYQYAIVARSYVLIPLFLFLTAIAWKQSNSLKIALWLGLLANVELHATAVSLGLAFVYYWQSRRGRKVDHRTAAVILFVALLAIAVLTVFPQPKDIVVRLPLDDVPKSLWLPVVCLRCLIYPARALVPHPWQLGVLCLVALIWALRTSIDRLYLVPLLPLVLFSGYYFSFWHLGIMTVTCIALAWIAWPIQVPTILKRIVAISAVASVIVMQLAYTAHALICDHYYPYSGDLAAARYLLPFAKSATPMAVTYVREAKAASFFEVGLRPYIPGPIFMNEPDPFWKFSTHDHTRVAFEAALKQRPPIVVVEYDDIQLRPLDLEREKYSRALSHLREQGYVLTHIFCGIKPEDLRDRSSLCHIIFELPSGSSKLKPVNSVADREHIR